MTFLEVALIVEPINTGRVHEQHKNLG
jgi:hypothetical protein